MYASRRRESCCCHRRRCCLGENTQEVAAAPLRFVRAPLSLSPIVFSFSLLCFSTSIRQLYLSLAAGMHVCVSPSFSVIPATETLPFEWLARETRKCYTLCTLYICIYREREGERALSDETEGYLYFCSTNKAPTAASRILTFAEKYFWSDFRRLVLLRRYYMRGRIVRENEWIFWAPGFWFFKLMVCIFYENALLSKWKYYARECKSIFKISCNVFFYYAYMNVGFLLF